MDNPNACSGADRRWLRRYAVFIILLTTIPYLAAFASQNTDWVFTGFLLGVDDGNSYIAKMLAGANGAWLFRSPYSTLPQSGLLFIYLPYLMLGKLAAPPEIHLQLVLLFQLLRVAGVVAVTYASYDFIALFESRPNLRRLGTVLTTCGGGLGWLFVLAGGSEWLGSLPLEFYSPESFGFLGLFGLPHLAIGRALLLWGLIALMKPAAGGWRARGLKSGALLLGAGFFNPINPAIGWLLIGSFLLVRFLVQWGAHTLAGQGARRLRLTTLVPSRRKAGGWLDTMKAGVLAGLISLPVVGYSLIASLTDPFFHGWASQNAITSPHPLHYLAAYGFFLPWAYRGARRLLRDQTPESWIPVIWVTLLPVLAYAPVNLQRRLPEAAFIALVVLAVRGIGDDRLSEPVRGRSMWPFVLVLPSTVILLAGALMAALGLSKPVFRPAAEVAAFEYLGANVERNAVVLAPLSTGNALPAFAPLRVVIGHGPETIGFQEILPRVEAFFSGQLTADEAAALLEEFGAGYVLFTPGDVTPEWEGAPLYSVEGFIIYAVGE